MKIKLDIKNIYILCWAFMMVMTSACSSQSQSDKGNENDRKLLKYTTAVRSILEDSKGNIWFGSHNEGVVLAS